MWPDPESLKNTMSPSENSILERERLSIDVSSVPLPLSLWDICSSCPLVLLSAGRSVCVCVRACTRALLEVGLAARLVWGMLWHLPLWKGLACALVGHYIYQWLIVANRSPWKHNRDLWPRRAQRQRAAVTLAPGCRRESKQTNLLLSHLNLQSLKNVENTTSCFAS